MRTRSAWLSCSRNPSLASLSQSAVDFWVLIYPSAIALGKISRVPVLCIGSTKPSLFKGRWKVRCSVLGFGDATVVFGFILKKNKNLLHTL